jgi:endonuclease/exonuclease/phosphatase (EEP) superfamily protein YafD
MGVFARYPCVEHQQTLGEFWTGLPQVVDVTLPGEEHLIVANIHTLPPHALLHPPESEGVISQLSSTVGIREEWIERLLHYLAGFQGASVVIAGDLNATSRSAVYARLRRAGFADAWAAGNPFGGGTWPASTWPFVSWLFRIDYVFHSADIVTERVAVLDDSFGSDHRGIVADVAVRPHGLSPRAS